MLQIDGNLSNTSLIALDKQKINFSLATPLITLNIVHMIVKKQGKGTAINEVQRPSTKTYLSEYERIFAKPTTKKSK